MLLSKLTKKGQPTTKAKDSTFFENRQLDFIAERDPLFFMIQWLTEYLAIDVWHHGNGRLKIESE
ncbi:MAG TPA: hypothetical protein PLF83_05130 [Rectinema sp.]|jgi:hypothetical protein|nr:hypothetical protein [Rectinema sp.]